MDVVISRHYGLNQTSGCLVIFEGDSAIFNCKTMELPNRGNAHGISCIPPGIYNVEKIKSTTKGECFSLKNVPDRSGILIHSGNYASGYKTDTKGCILVGTNFKDINIDGNLDVIDSIKTLGILITLLPGKFKLYIL
jgi:hypothetical protein